MFVLVFVFVPFFLVLLVVLLLAFQKDVHDS